MSKTALIILHPGFEELEAIAPIDILRRGGVKVTVASQHSGLSVTGRNGITLQAECPLDTVLNKSFDALILPGGPGVYKSLRTDSRLIDLTRRSHESGRLVAAICAAPLVLHDAGLLQGRSYTAHFATSEELPQLQADQPVVTDGNLITSRGAGTATAFALTLLSRLVDTATATAVAESICLMDGQ